MHLAEDYQYGAIEVDYGLSVAEVYCSVPKYFVDRYQRYGPSGCLAFLCVITSESLESIHGLPSWCPDWSSEKSATVVLDMRISSSDPPFVPAAGQVRGNKPWFSLDGKVLHAQGFCLDTVSAMCISNSADLIKDDLPISEILSTYLPIMASGDDENFAEADIDNFCLPLLRSLIAGHEFEGAERAWAELIKLCGNPMTADMSLTNVQPLLTKDVLELMSSMALAGEDRVLFRGGRGSVGLIPKETSFEDRVWILFDCPAPIVLRPIDDYYAVVGVAYVDGFMHGESCSDMPSVVGIGEKYGDHEIATVQIK
jgi:hypothetical protein